MARFRLSGPAQADLANILWTSAQRWGKDAERRYAALLAAAIRKAASDTEGLLTRDRSELAPGVRSLHIRLAGAGAPGTKVRKPVHILYYRIAAPGMIEIVRVLHERSDPGRHLDEKPDLP